MILGSYRALALTILALFILSGCAETQLLAYTAKRMGHGGASDYGAYKIGDPYKIGGVWYYPHEDFDYVETGIASWYGPQFHRRRTANGELFNMNELSAAHRTLPMPSLVQVTNLENGRSLKVRVNDRGPFAHGRIIDLSRRAAQLLGFERKGTARVRVEILGAESRALAQRLKGETQLASADLPIRSDVQMAKPVVSAETLAPPPGGHQSQIAAPKTAPAVPAENERVTLAPQNPDGTVTIKAVENTNIWVQAGAFTSFENANRVKAVLYKFSNVQITSKIVKGQEFFRVRSGPIKSVREADRLLERVIRAGYSDAQIVVE